MRTPGGLLHRVPGQDRHLPDRLGIRAFPTSSGQRLAPAARSGAWQAPSFTVLPIPGDPRTHPGSGFRSPLSSRRPRSAPAPGECGCGAPGIPGDVAQQNRRVLAGAVDLRGGAGPAQRATRSSRTLARAMRGSGTRTGWQTLRRLWTRAAALAQNAASVRNRPGRIAALGHQPPNRMSWMSQRSTCRPPKLARSSAASSFTIPAISSCAGP